MKIFILPLISISIFFLSCKSVEKAVVNPVEENQTTEDIEPMIVKEENSIGDLWLDDNTYLVSATGYPRTDSKTNSMESALNAAYELAYIKIEYEFLKEMKATNNDPSEAIRKIADKYRIETKVEYVSDRYVELTFMVQVKNLRPYLKSNNLGKLLE